MSREEEIVRTALALRNPVSRRVFMQLAGAAGISVPLAGLGGPAFAQPAGKISARGYGKARPLADNVASLA